MTNLPLKFHIFSTYIPICLKFIKFMSIKINYQKNQAFKNLHQIVLFSNEKFNFDNTKNIYLRN